MKNELIENKKWRWHFFRIFSIWINFGKWMYVLCIWIMFEGQSCTQSVCTGVWDNTLRWENLMMWPFSVALACWPIALRWSLLNCQISQRLGWKSDHDKTIPCDRDSLVEFGCVCWGLRRHKYWVQGGGKHFQAVYQKKSFIWDHGERLHTLDTNIQGVKHQWGVWRDRRSRGRQCCSFSAKQGVRPGPPSSPTSNGIISF